MSTVDIDYRAGLLDASALLAAYMRDDTDGCHCIIRAQDSPNGIVWGLIQIAASQVLERSTLAGVEVGAFLATLHVDVRTAADRMFPERPAS